jgi:hypothetical protein
MKTVKRSESVVKEIPLDQIIVDPTIQPRVEQSEETIFRYSLSLAKGDLFPPIDVFELAGKYLLADGGHRLEAYRLEGRDTIPGRIHQGGRKEALAFAAGSNVKHGLLRDNKAKHRVVENVLKDPELGLLSNNKIAEICVVSQPFVGRVRWELSCNGYKFDSVRLSSKGREIQTANIGQKKRSAKSKVKPEAADASTAKEVPNGSGEAIAPPESDFPPDGPAPAEVSPQQSGGVNPVQEGGETQPDEQKYPNDPAVLKRLLEQEKAEKVKLQGKLDAQTQWNKELLNENRKLKEEVEYLREQLTEDTTV